MRYIAFKFLLLGVLVLIGSIVIVLVSYKSDSPKYSYLSEGIAKDARLAVTPSPRIIFVGGSGLAFGLDSARIEQATGLPVVNMGLHVGLGLRYMLTEVQRQLRRGDIVVIVPEYEEFYTYLDGDSTLLDGIIANPEGVRNVTSPQQVTILAKGILVSIQDMFKAKLDAALFPAPPPTGLVYYRGGFNAEGDLVSHLNKPSSDVSEMQLGIRSDVDAETLAVLNDFERTATNKSARVLLSFSAIPVIQYKAAQNELREICDALQTKTQIALLGNPADSVFPENDFFDTAYHMNAQGRDARMDKLIPQFKSALASTNNRQTCD